MNREQRRSNNSAGDLKYLQTPCTITEATQIARGVAEDVVSDFIEHQSPLQVAMSLQIEILKDIVISSGLVTKERFYEMYVEKAEEFNRKQREAFDNIQEDDSPKMELKVNDVEIIKE